MTRMLVSRNGFRILVCATFILDVAAGLIDVFFPSLIPEAARLAHAQATTVLDTALSIAGVTAVLIAVIGVVASIGLLLFMKPARPLFVAVFAASCVWTAFFGPQLSSGPSEAVFLFSDFVVGVVVAMMYLTPVNSYFARHV